MTRWLAIPAAASIAFGCGGTLGPTDEHDSEFSPASGTGEGATSSGSPTEQRGSPAQGSTETSGEEAGSTDPDVDPGDTPVGSETTSEEGGGGAAQPNEAEERKQAEEREEAATTERNDVPRYDDARRLTRSEYTATLESLLGQEVIGAIETVLRTHPSDDAEDRFESMAQGTTVLHAEAHNAVANAVATALLEDEASRTELAPCLNDLSDRECVSDFVSDFGSQVFRRPLTSSEHAELLERYDDGLAISEQDGFRALIQNLLLSPHFLFRLEYGASELSDGQFTLSDHEWATRLAFATTGTTPDTTLLGAATDGSLATENGRTEQVERLLNLPKARQHLVRFFGEWLQFRHLPAAQHPEEFLAGVDPNGLNAQMSAELSWFVAHHLFDNESSYQALHTSRASDVNGALADIYGTTKTGVQQLGPERRGMLSRAGFLIGAGVTTQPIHRGNRILNQLLCIELPLPETQELDAPVAAPAFDSEQTARERWTTQTSQASCAGCHSMINPFGFAFEEFDSIGRARELENIWDPETGELVNQLPIDVEVVVNIDGEPRTIEGAAGMGAALATSSQALDCFHRKWFLFTQGRRVGSYDQPLLSQLTERSATQGDSILASIRSFLLSEQFQTRYFSPVDTQ